MKFFHKAIYGITDTGKSWLLKRLVKVLRKNKQKVIVYSAAGDMDWPAGCQFFFDVDKLEEALGKPENFGAHVILDEAQVLYESMVKVKKHPILYYMGTMGRHKGYTMYVATQRPARIPTHVRDNCQECYVFLLGSMTSAKVIEDDYGNDLIHAQLGEKISKAIKKLPRLQCLHIRMPDKIEVINL